MKPIASDLTRASGGAWLTVALLWLVGCFNYLDRISITTMRSSLKEEFVMTDAQSGVELSKARMKIGCIVKASGRPGGWPPGLMERFFK